MPHCTPHIIAILAILLVAPALRAADVELKAGGRLTAVQVTYYADTNQFTMNDGRTTLRYPASDIKSLVVDESKFGDLTSRLRAAEKQASDSSIQNAQMREQLAQTMKTNAELQKKNQDLAGALATGNDQSAALNDQVRQLTRQVGTLEARNKRLGELSSTQTTTQVAPAKIEKPAIGKITWKPGRETGFVEVRGTCINTSANAYHEAVIEISVNDKGGNLLANVATSIANFAPGEKRDFSTDVEVDAAEIGNVEAVVGDLFRK